MIILSTNYERTTTTERVIDRLNFDSESSKIDVEEYQLRLTEHYSKHFIQKSEKTFLKTVYIENRFTDPLN